MARNDATQAIVGELEQGAPFPLGCDVVGLPRSSTADLDVEALDVGRLPLGFGERGGTVVAGPPDDALEMARLEILAALTGAPTPGAI